MLNLARYPGQSILFEYNNKVLELLYYDIDTSWEPIRRFHIYINGILKAEYEFEGNYIIKFHQDSLLFEFAIYGRDHGQRQRSVKISSLPYYVKIRRKELQPKVA